MQYSMSSIFVYIVIMLASFNAHSMDATREDAQRIARLYTAAFAREPDLAGLNFWIDKLELNMGIDEISERFYDSSEFKNTYGDLSNVDFLTTLYQNVMNREPDKSGLAYWLERMESGTSAARVLSEFSDSTENRNNTTELYSNLYMSETGKWRLTPPPLDTSYIEDSVSIHQGIYGLTTAQDDVGYYDPVEVFPGFHVDVFFDAPSRDLDQEVMPLLSTESDYRGFYELPLQTGEYYVCTSFRRCTTVSIVDGKALRLDYMFDNGPGWSF